MCEDFDYIKSMEAADRLIVAGNPIGLLSKRKLLRMIEPTIFEKVLQSGSVNNQVVSSWNAGKYKV